MTASGERFRDLYDRRKGVYAKDAASEDFLTGLNEYLAPRELELYEDQEVVHPCLFVVGLPRSGTTLLSQLLAYCLDVGYVTNVAARFWRAPVHGIRLSHLIVGEAEAAFESDFARTSGLAGIHEFGYFWGYWLRKQSFDDVVHARELENEIDWEGLCRTVANVQQALGKPWVAKNMLGAYHMPRLLQELGKVVYVYVERDPLDAAVSILDARRKYYGDPSTWWSYVPLEYPLLAERDCWEQIAGQVHYLGRFYERALAEVGQEHVVRVTYRELCADPAGVLEAVSARAAATYGQPVGVRRRPPSEFPFRRHDDRGDEKAQFEEILARLASEAA